MTEEEILELIKTRLSVRVNVKADPWNDSMFEVAKDVYVSLYLDGKKISESEASL